MSRGTVSFRLYEPLTDQDTLQVSSGTTDVRLSPTGTISVVLPASNDPTSRPEGTPYLVTENIDNVQRTYYVTIPYDAPDGTVDLASLVPLQPPFPGFDPAQLPPSPVGQPDGYVPTVMDGVYVLEPGGGAPGDWYTLPEREPGQPGWVNTTDAAGFNFGPFFQLRTINGGTQVEVTGAGVYCDANGDPTSPPSQSVLIDSLPAEFRTSVSGGVGVAALVVDFGTGALTPFVLDTGGLAGVSMTASGSTTGIVLIVPLGSYLTA